VAVVVSGFFRDFEGGAYGAGQMTAWFFGLALGVRAIVKGREARN
jgi:hypothetical protein